MSATNSPLVQLAQHILAMANDDYLTGHPEWAEIVREAESALAETEKTKQADGI